MTEDRDFFLASALDRPTMVSYAGNREDVRLRRIVPLLPSRTYVDVGAGDPIDGSVTYWLYEQGWRGVLVEPGSRSAALSSVRPGDVVVEAAVGAPPEGITLFETHPDPGMSTIRRDRLPELASLGHSWEERHVGSVSLQEIFEEHTREPVAVLNVDVEGAERQVLDSLDWSSHRPTVVVVESIEPWRPVSTHHDWEPILVEAGYRLAAFDGVNRFFVDGRAGNADQIVDALAHPISALDRFVSVDEHRARAELQGLREELHRSMSTKVQLETELHDTRAKFDRAQHELRRLQGLHRSDTDRLTQARADLEQANDELRRLREQRSIDEARIADLESASDEREQYIVDLTVAHHDLERRLGEILGSRTWRYVVPFVHRARRRLAWLRPAIRLFRLLRRPGAVRRAKLFGWARRQARLGVLWLQGPKRLRERAVARHTHPAFLAAESQRPPPTGAPSNGTWAELATQRLADTDDELLMREQNDGQVRPSLDRQIQLAALAEEASKSGKGRPAGDSERPAVLFDARCLQEPSLATRGVGRYALETLQQVRTHVDDRQLYLFTDASLPTLALELGDAHCIQRLSAQLGRRIGWFIQPSPVTADSWQLASILNNADVYCTTICYDFIPAKYPDCYLPDSNARLLHDARQQSIRLYDEVWGISRATLGELREFVGRPRRESVVWPANTMEMPARVTPSVSLPDSYVLIAAGDEPRKNVIGGLGAVAHLKGAHRDIAAVLLGWSGSTDRAMEWAAQVGLPERAVVILPHLPAAEVAAVRHRAQASIVPSFAEGLSLPVIESVEDGTPVVASRIAAHRELLGDGPWLARPWLPSELGDALAYVLARRDDVVRAQQRALAEHPHVSIAEAVTATFLQLNSGRPSRGAAIHNERRPSLGVVTPWPPQPSGVADYSAFTLKALEEHVDAVFYTTTSANPADVPSRPASPMVPGLAEHDTLLTVLGNSHFHLPGLEIIETYGGAALCHDVRMTELNRHLGLSDDLGRGRRGVAEARATRHELDAVPTLGFGHVAKYCDLLLFHSRQAAERVAAETGAQTAALPFVPYRLPSPGQLDPGSRQAARARLGLEDDCLHIGLLGGVDTRTKASDVVIEALAWLNLWGHDAKLHIVGDLTFGPIDELQRLVGAAGIRQHVHWYNRVDEQRYRDFLVGVDVGVQVRLASLLTISGAVADLVAFGVPTVATSAMAEDMGLPPFVLPLSDDFSPLILAERLLEAAEVRHSDGSIAEQRLEYVSEHSRDRYVHCLLQALGLT